MPEEQNQNQDAPATASTQTSAPVSDSAPNPVQPTVFEPVFVEIISSGPTAENGLVPENENAPANNEGDQTLESEKAPQNLELAGLANSQSSPTQTAQMGGNEPLGFVAETAETKLASESLRIPAESYSPQEQVSAPVSRNAMRELFVKAQSAIQGRRRKKLERIMTLFENKSSVANDEVEKLLHISDATATRYLEILEKENKIKQNGKTGKAVSYVKT